MSGGGGFGQEKKKSITRPLLFKLKQKIFRQKKAEQTELSLFVDQDSIQRMNEGQLYIFTVTQKTCTILFTFLEMVNILGHFLTVVLTKHFFIYFPNRALTS